jgi:PKD repeat protein
LALILVALQLATAMLAGPANAQSSAASEQTDIATIMIRDQSVARNATILFTVVAPDPVTPPAVLAYSMHLGTPPASGARIDPSTGVFSWTPTSTQAAGTYPITICATPKGGSHAFACGTFTVNVIDANAAPVARDSGPYTGVAKALLNFDASASKDPNGEPLTYSWYFGDGDSSTSVAPTHAYSMPGIYNVKLRVRNRIGVSGEDATTAVITPFFWARAYLESGGEEMEFGDDEALECVRIEPTTDAFSIWNVDPSSIRILDRGRVIPASMDGSDIATDEDKNGIQEVTVCFPASQIRALLAGRSQDYVVRIDGKLTTGGSLQGTLTLHNEGSRASKAFSASVSPNPMNPAANVHFKTTKPGSLSVALFDARGRLVRSFLRDPAASAGDYNLQIEACDTRGSRLSSGIYYLKIQSSSDGEMTKTIAVLK